MASHHSQKKIAANAIQKKRLQEYTSTWWVEVVTQEYIPLLVVEHTTKVQTLQQIDDRNVAGVERAARNVRGGARLAEEQGLTMWGRQGGCGLENEVRAGLGNRK